MCGLNVGPTVRDMGLLIVFSTFFGWAFGGPELGTNWVLVGLLCGSQVDCPQETQLILAKCFTKVPIKLAHVLRFECPMLSQTGEPGQPDRFFNTLSAGVADLAKYQQ